MRFLLKVHIPVEAGNQAVLEGRLVKTIQKILEAQRPEEAYFTADSGERTGLLIVNLENASKIPAMAEPWFLAFKAAIDFQPLMTLEDLQKAAPDITTSAKICAQELVGV
jgi:hypothetical protein